MAVGLRKFADDLLTLVAFPLEVVALVVPFAAVLFLLGVAATLLTDDVPDEADDADCLLEADDVVVVRLTLEEVPMPPRVDTLLVKTLSEPVYALGPCQWFVAGPVCM